ncbi:MAG: hypothetical protein VX589_15625 [Myxococcota bacterium]|nr:hypothetical protein [Myxococcota bacterium]
MKQLDGWVLIILSMTMLACGGQRVATTSKRAPADPLNAALTSMIEAQQKPQAKMTFALFGGSELADEKRLRVILEETNREVYLSSTPPPGPYQPTLIVAPVDAKLPVHMSAIIDVAGELAARLRQATHVAFVQYLGPARDDDAALRAAATALARMADSNDVLVDMSLHRVFTRAAWKTWMEAADWLADQVVPGVEAMGDNRVTFYTRGMAKFGQPDLEWAGIKKANAREKFGEFQAMIAEVRARRATRIGDTVAGRTFIACTRPPEAIELDCVGIQ